MLFSGTPSWNHVSRIATKTQETKDTHNQQANANGKHLTMFVCATDHIRILQEALFLVGMCVARQWDKRGSTHRGETHLSCKRKQNLLYYYMIGKKRWWHRNQQTDGTHFRAKTVFQSSVHIPLSFIHYSSNSSHE